MSKLDELLKATADDSHDNLLGLVSKVLAENRDTFDDIAKTVFEDVNGNAIEVYKRLVREMFADGVVYWGRISVFFALSIFFRDRFNLYLDDEATNLMTLYIPNWIKEQQSTLRWKSACFYAGLACAVISVKLIKATLLSHFFHSSR